MANGLTFEGWSRVYFVVSDEYESEGNCTQEMLDAFQKCQNNGISSQWIKEKECSTLNPEKNHIFVLEKFEGEVFERLQSIKCLILGPKYLLHCFSTNEPISSHPTLNTAMRGIIACFTGFDENLHQEHLYHQKIEYMGGICVDRLHPAVTHLIANSVITEEYEEALKKGIRVHPTSWIDEVYSTNLHHNIPATDEEFQDHQVPVFLNVKVLSTHLPSHQKEKIKKFVERNGGEYNLSPEKIDVLVAKYTSKSEKIKYAMKYDIPCVSPDWVIQSLKAGHFLPFREFPMIVSKREECLTPEEGLTPEESTNSTVESVRSSNSEHNPEKSINRSSSGPPGLPNCEITPEKAVNSIKNEQNPEESIDGSSSDPPGLPNWEIKTPERPLDAPQIQDTPAVFKRLKEDVNNSPFHVSTPDTPYGQVFFHLGENPSPSTRKLWKKWTEDLPEKSQEVKPRERKLSTPLSELKLRLWSALKKPKCRNGDKRDEEEQVVPINRELSFDDEILKKTEVLMKLND